MLSHMVKLSSAVINKLKVPLYHCTKHCSQHIHQGLPASSIKLYCSFSNANERNSREIHSSSCHLKSLREHTTGDQSKEDYSHGEDYRQQRLQHVSRLKADGKSVYPHIANLHADVVPLGDFLEQYNHLSPGECCDTTTVAVAGRVFAIRNSGNKLRFFDLREKDLNSFGKGDFKLQVMASSKHYGADQSSFTSDCDSVKRGDIVLVRGCPLRTKTGQLSVRPATVQVLSPCLRMLPSLHFGVKDTETRYRDRCLDMIINPDTLDKFIILKNIKKHISNFLEERDFLEVTTEVANVRAGGASATPFMTYHNAYELNLALRVAPELPLKKLVIGGANKVFEIGPQFRNEGVDKTHYPEFTTCELYMAYADYTDLLSLTETLLSGMVLNIFGSHEVLYQPNGQKDDETSTESWTINYGAPYKRVQMLPELERVLQVKFPEPNELHSENSRQFLDDLCTEKNVVCAAPRTSARLLNKLVGKFIESECIQPTFIMDHPEIMSPLAKAHRSIPGLVERFELVIGKMEICNAYSELDDPIEQRKRFSQQALDQAQGDTEAQPQDEDFCNSMELGMPPTAGLGIGIERLGMLLTNSDNIRELILNPILKPIDTGVKKEEIIKQTGTVLEENISNSISFIESRDDCWAEFLNTAKKLKELASKIEQDSNKCDAFKTHIDNFIGSIK